LSNGKTPFFVGIKDQRKPRRNKGSGMLTLVFLKKCDKNKIFHNRIIYDFPKCMRIIVSLTTFEDLIYI